MSTMRAVGSAMLSFGLVSIPTKLYTTADKSSEVSFNMLHDACGSRLKQQYVCTKDGEVVDRDHTTKGYEFTKDQYVVFTGDELKALDAVATNSIEIVEFVPTSAIDVVLIEKSYYLGPDKGGERAYALLAEVLRLTGQVGIAHYSARGKQYILAVQSYKNGLAAIQLRYADEVKSWGDVPMPNLPETRPAELALAQQLVGQISSQTFELTKYQDDVKIKMLALIQAKIAGQEITAAPSVPKGQIVDIMEALKASIAGGPKATPAATPALSAAPMAQAAVIETPPSLVAEPPTAKPATRRRKKA